MLISGDGTWDSKKINNAHTVCIYSDSKLYITCHNINDIIMLQSAKMTSVTVLAQQMCKICKFLAL